MMLKSKQTAPHLNGSNNRGSGLIEILVLVLVMAVGMLAMGKIHTVLIRDGGTANNRSIAISLAQEKLDDLRSFKWLNTTQAEENTSDENCTNAPCYSSIGTGTATPAGLGGLRLKRDLTMPDGTVKITGDLLFPAGSITIGNTTFTRSWTVTDNCWNTDKTALITTCGTGVTPDVKYIAMIVSWTDQNGVQQVQLTTSIAKDDPLLAAFVRESGTGAGGYGPKVQYTKGTAPDVVPLPISQGTVNKETSKPLPDVVSAGNSVATSFETVTYKTGATDTKQVLDDFVTVSCSCKFTSSGAGYPASYYYWDAESKAIKVNYPTATVTKSRGVSAVNGQHALCNSCCNDHHDDTGNTATALYDTTRPSADFTTGGDHEHYYYVDENNPSLGLQKVNVANNNKYLEACRYLRVDGYYRLMQDWLAKDLIVLPKNNYLTVSTKLESYQNYILNGLRYWISQDCTSASGTNCNSSGAPSKSTLSPRDLNNQTGNVQLLARAVYLDKVYGKTSPRTLDSTYYTYLASQITANQSDTTKVWLDIVPFNEVNTTLLTSWGSNNTSVATVTNDPIVDITASSSNYYGVYSRGMVTVQGAGSANINAYLLPSNSGLTGGSKQSTYSNVKDYDPVTLADATNTTFPREIGIDKHDHSSALIKTDYLTISTTSTPGITGQLHLGNISGSLASVSVNAIPTTGSPSACTITLSEDLKTGGYNCNVPNGFTGKVRISSSVTTDFFDYGTDTTFYTRTNPGLTAESPQYTNVTSPINAGVFWVFGQRAEVRGNINCNPAETCNNVTVTATPSSNTPPLACTITGSTVKCPIDLSASDHYWSGTISIANNLGFNYTVKADCATAGTSVTLSNIGPADAPSSLNMCVSSSTALNSCTLGSTTVSSGQSLIAYLTQSVTWPSVCSQETRICNDGTLNGSTTYQYDSCSQTQTAPTPSWTGTNSPKTLSWPSMGTNVTYRVYTCTASGCTPNSASGGTSIGTTTSYTPSLTGNGSVCIIVRGEYNASLSNPSAKFCASRSGNNYTYSP